MMEPIQQNFFSIDEIDFDVEESAAKLQSESDRSVLGRLETLPSGFSPSEVRTLGVDDVRVACPLFQAGSGGSTPTSTLQLRIEEIGKQKAEHLNYLWHSVLPTFDTFGSIHEVCYVADFEGVFYAVAIWTDPIAANRLKDGWKLLELRRMAIAPDAPKNTASRMLSIMRRLIRKKFPDLLRLISYQSVDHHHGTIYKAAGWKAVAESIYQQWHPNEERAMPQTVSKKIRWEINL